ncbi:phosphotransferase family protein [Nocardia carnea]|uniref:phosphotransferase family protein n=1 Tax=Nocardia carnea TaxID=37328 RepID=UPI002453EA7D|nr:aminoglycoside phosphotransferase family protein [Nocardia carnea]
MTTTAGPAPFDEAVVLSPEWLTGVLDSGSGAIPVATEVVERIETVATKLRFRVTYSGPAGTPPALCAKGYFNPAHRRGSRAEADFYRLPARRLPVRTPPCVHAAVDETTGHALVLMHDLVEVGARFLDPLVGYSPDRAAGTLDQLAALHAATWGSREYDMFPPRLASLAGHMTPEKLQPLLDDGRAGGIPDPVRRADRLLAAMAAMDTLGAASTRCLVHGDLHAGNIYEMPDGSPGLIDWQVVQCGHWAQDVAYHLATVLHPGDLAGTERALLDHYLDRLAGYGVEPPDREHAWWMYRAHLPYGFYLWSMTRAVDRPIIEHLTGRLATAVARHDSFGLLGV